MTAAFPEWLSVLLSWLAPPVIGAVIGFVTNDIAIRMLFRPLTEKRIFGIRIPFTPGIIPKQRKNLASSIGRMVSDELLTEEAVRAQVESERVQSALRENIAGLTDSILGVSLSSLSEQRLPLFQATFPEILSGFLKTFLKSPLFASALESLVGAFWDSLAGTSVKAAAAELKLRPFLDEKIASLIEGDAVRDKLKESLAGWAGTAAGREAPMAGLVSDSLAVTAAAVFRSLLPDLLAALKGWLDTPEVRRGLETKGKLLLDDIFSKLNIFQRFFVSVGAYDRTLSEQMPAIVSDFLNRVGDSLQSEEEKDAVVKAFGNALESWRKKGLKDLLPKDEQALAGKIGGWVDRAFEFLRREKLSQKLAGAVGEYLVSRESDTLGGLAESLFGLEKKQAVDFIVSRFANQEFVDRAAERIASFALDFFQAQGALTLGQVLGVDKERKTEFDNRAVAALNGVLASQLPAALMSLDLRGLVENKINGLDIKAVENLLLMLIAKQLKWINIFGAILGGLIGLIQVVLRLAGMG